MTRSAETHPLAWRLREDTQPIWLEEYQSKDGYAAVHKALIQMAQDDIVQTVKDSGLKGRGGAGLPIGVKWDLMPKDESLSIRYLLCNVDEMEPNIWKDRTLMEQLLHLLVEGMLISARALKAYRGYVFLCGKYVDAVCNLNRVIDEAKAASLLGKNILGSGFDFELFVHTGAGCYTCGEETALISSLEGCRANPRPRPPLPAAIDVWGKPTCVNNVETLHDVPAIVGNGVDWYKTLARPDSEDMGTKLMGFSGKVKNPGPWKLPFGVSARELFGDCVGDMHDGFQLKAWQPDGAGTGFPLPEHLGTQTFVDDITKVGARMGTGPAMVVDGSINMVSLLRNMGEFFAHESYGWCISCRDGLSWSVKLLCALERGEGQPDGLETLEQLVSFLGPGKTSCAHAPGAVGPLGSALKYLRAESEADIFRQPSAASRPATAGA